MSKKKKISYIDMTLLSAIVLLFLSTFDVLSKETIGFIGIVLLFTFLFLTAKYTLETIKINRKGKSKNEDDI